MDVQWYMVMNLQWRTTMVWMRNPNMDRVYHIILATSKSMVEANVFQRVKYVPQESMPGGDVKVLP